MSRASPRYHRNNASLPAAPLYTWQVSVIGLIEGQQTITTFYYADAGVTPATGWESNIANAWNAAFGAAFRGACSSDWTLTGIKVQCLSLPARMPFLLVLSSPGTGPSGHFPTNVAVTMDRYSLVKGQAGRGRVSMPAVPLTWVTASTVNATGLIGYTSILADLGTAFTANAQSYVAMVVSKKNKNGPALGASPVQTVLLRSTIGSCRRRKLGRGK